MKTHLWSLSPSMIPKAWWTLWAPGCRNQTDRWSHHAVARSSARGGQHLSSQADCWGSGSGLEERKAGCGGVEQRRAPAASSEPPQHLEWEGAEEVEGRRLFSSSHAPYLHEKRGGGERGRWSIWRPINLYKTCLLKYIFSRNIQFEAWGCLVRWQTVMYTLLPGKRWHTL